MKILFLGVIAATLYSLVITETSLETCKCWDGYEPRNGTDGPECAGIFLRNVMSCNILRLPQCVCTGTVSRIIIEKDGPWCSRIKNGKEIRRWGCENKKEWDEYDKQLAASISKKLGVEKD